MIFFEVCFLLYFFKLSAGNVFFIVGYLVKFKESTVNSELLNLKGDYLLNVRPKYVTLSTSGPKEQQNCVLSWSLDTIKSYNSRPTESNPTMKLLTIETGRLVDGEE